MPRSSSKKKFSFNLQLSGNNSDLFDQKVGLCYVRESTRSSEVTNRFLLFLVLLDFAEILTFHVYAALADKPHPEFGNLNFGKKNWKEIKITQKWNLEEDVLPVNALFIQGFRTRQPPY